MASPQVDNSSFWALDAAPAGGNRRAGLQISVAFGLILLAVWMPLPWQLLVSTAALAWVILSTLGSSEGWGAMGLNGRGFHRSLWVVGAALLLAAGGVLVAERMQTLHAPPHPIQLIQRFWGYAIWSFLQEFLLLDFFLLRMLRLLPGRAEAAIATASLFAIAHLPNPILTVLTLLWGWASCRLFLHYRNLYALGLSHAILGICIAITIPGPVDHNMRVGLGYLTYRSNKHPHRSQKDQTVSTHAWVMTDAPTRRSWRQALP